MSPELLLGVLRQRGRLRRHEGWSRERLEVHQARELRRLRDFAYARSPFYARHHRGLFDRPLHELPPVTKKELMASFDEAITEFEKTAYDYPGNTKGQSSAYFALLSYNEEEKNLKGTPANSH